MCPRKLLYIKKYQERSSPFLLKYLKEFSKHLVLNLDKSRLRTT